MVLKDYGPKGAASGQEIVPVDPDQIDWSYLRFRYESDPAFRIADIARAVGQDRSAISKRVKREKWTRVGFSKSDEVAVRQQAHDRADEKAEANPMPLQAIDHGPSPVAVKSAVEMRADMLDRHRREWNLPRNHIYSAMNEAKTNPAKGFEMAKMAKITAEAFSIIHQNERKAWNIDNDKRIVVEFTQGDQIDEWTEV